MFPNYCFTKSIRNSEYDVTNRNYTGRDSFPRRNDRPAARSVSTARNCSEVRSSASGLKRPKGQKKGSNKSKTRKVGFRLETREDAGSNRSHSTEEIGEPKTAKKMDHDLQDSFTDFFTIIHDNVMESVKDAVQVMVAKCFEESITKMERLSKNILSQEALLNKIYHDLTSKISAQSETNLNQFKFVTQMLIDNQTVHYRALNQAKLNRQRRKEERELQKEKKLERERMRSPSPSKARSSSMETSKRSLGGDGKEAQARAPQHKLCQQQQTMPYQICPSCTDQESSRMSRSSSRHENSPRFQRRSTSSSMPNLPRSTSYASTRLAQPLSKISVSRPYSNKLDRVICQPAMTYPTQPRRRFPQHTKSGTGQ